jgi:hypothetical protein
MQFKLPFNADKFFYVTGKKEKCRHKIVFFIICDVVCNTLQQIKVSGFAEMHVEKTKYLQQVMWLYKAEKNSQLFFTEYT